MTRRTRLLIIVGLTVAPFAGVLSLPPIPQSRDYHAFADNRSLLGIPHFFDVVSNAAFIVVGAAGLLALYRPRPDGRSMFAQSSDRWPYGVLFLGVALTGVGSAYYHLAPDNTRLVWDRMPMALAFAALLSAVVTERIHGPVGVALQERHGDVAGARNLKPVHVREACRLLHRKGLRHRFLYGTAKQRADRLIDPRVLRPATSARPRTA